ncbi:poly [ADP-ribose] polymerase tankyrase-2-like [Choristoneura fumiferana]|uniref:poly [ADP-ribose] polymerase tankyrase-2-like n=1 Tax=Choristoneura fumiferana TaxID=7141 RepID=UPI003D15F0C2
MSATEPIPVVSANAPSCHSGQLLPSGRCVELPPPELPSAYRERVISEQLGNVPERSASVLYINTLRTLLDSIGLEQLAPALEREQITVDMLAEMSHEDLREVGVAAYGHRHRLMRAAREQLATKDCTTRLVEITFEKSGTCDCGQSEYAVIEREMKMTASSHRRRGFSHCNILKVEKIVNGRLWERYQHRRREVAAEAGSANERLLFHESPFINAIVQKGFDERLSLITGRFGAGIYFAEQCTSSNPYVFGYPYCPAHGDIDCYICDRQVLLCRVTLGRTVELPRVLRMAHAPPDHHSVSGRPSPGGPFCYDHVVYRGEQAYPEYIITYNIVQDGDHTAAVPT